MTFGGSPCPSQWSCISEISCDLANNLIQCNEWDHHALFSINQARIPCPLRLPDETPFVLAQELDLDMPHNNRGIVELGFFHPSFAT